MPLPELALSLETHRVENQAPPLNYNAWATDLPLKTALARFGSEAATGDHRLDELGQLVGGEMMELGRLANENRPKARIFDRYGHRLDEVEFHPAYHQLMAIALDHELPSFGWTHEDLPGAHVVRMAKGYLYNQADQGSACPLTMTYACVPTLRHQPELAAQWLPKVFSRTYDPRPGVDKAGVTIGMGMTEKQGGSDVRANSTRATPLEARGPGKAYALVGHKWFFSAPMCDAWLVLAYAERGLSCFLMPKILPDGARNPIHVQRLKDKLGDWSNASSEVELRGALGWLVGEEGRGVANILEMVALTRQDCMIGSAGLMRQALVQAIHHCRHRKAFGRTLIEQPLMRNVLADLAVESEAHLVLTARIAKTVDAARRDPHERALNRIATAIGKYWVCKRAPAFVNEAQECLGGAGYVEETPMPRLYRQAPLNSIWEGSGNIQCLDVLRALGREPESRTALLTELGQARGAHAALDRAIDQATRDLDPSGDLEPRARRVIEHLAITLTAALLAEGDSAVFQAWCGTRLGDRFASFGVLPPDAPQAAFIERAFPG